MKYYFIIIYSIISFIAISTIFGQDSDNCFLEDFEPKKAIIPPHQDFDKTSESASVTITINTADTIGKVSKYIFGNALAAWLGNDVYDPVLIGHLQKLAPTLIRYPGGSWSDIFFWNGNPGDLPTTIPDGAKNGNPISLSPQFGMNSWPTTVNNYYNMCWDVDTQGLITINYGYARYGLSEKPVEQAAHYAADWVRYDDGRTKFWEIGNENAGPWEAGWQIDTTTNQDGQPEIITGELYGQHFNIIADSMRAAAAELDNTIYIGGQILHFDGTNSWNVPDRQWNEGFFREVGNNADFYVIHNYIGPSADAKSLLNAALSIPGEMINFIHQDISQKQAFSKPVALTEWNMHWESPDLAKTSIINGMQAVITFCELIKRNYGMSSRWLIANTASDGMFYKGSNGSIPAWNPRPAFFYCYYLQKFTGDHALTLTVSTFYKHIVAYASTFSSGEKGVVVVNKGTIDQVVRLLFPEEQLGDYYYVYSLTGGTDNGDFSQIVYVNEQGPTGAAWGPIDELHDIPARVYPIGDEIKFTSPALSVQFLLIESDPFVNVIDYGNNNDEKSTSTTLTVYPSPVHSQFKINLQRSEFKRADIIDILGRIVYSQYISPNQTVLQIQPNLPSGIYFLRLYNNMEIKITKLIIHKVK